MRRLAVLWALAALPTQAQDVFVTQPVALVREGPEPAAKITGRLPLGARPTYVADAGSHHRIVHEDPSCGIAGYLAKEAAALFPAGRAASLEMATVGRFLAPDPSRRPLAIALLGRASERLADEGGPEPLDEIALGELLETDPSPFLRALEALHDEPDDTLRERAVAGLLAATYPGTGSGFLALLEETAAWMALAETATTPRVLSHASERLGRAALALGRLLLAGSRTGEVLGLSERLVRVASRLGEHDRARLSGRAEVLRAMAGSGGAPFPQAARQGGRTARIEGELGALVLRVGPGSLELPIPLLPVPGSLVVSPDGSAAAWLEVPEPGVVVPQVARLDGGAFGDPTRLCAGRPPRDRDRAHLIAELVAFSRDGRRLAFRLRAWDDTPPPAARTEVVDVRTGELLLDTAAAPTTRRVREALR